MDKFILLTMFLFLVPNISPAQNYTPINKDLDDVESMLNDLEKDTNTLPKTPVVKKPVVPVNKNLDDVDYALDDLAKDTGTASKTPLVKQPAVPDPKPALAPKPVPTPVPTAKAKPALKPKPVQGDDIYDFSYMQKHDDDEIAGYGKEEGSYGEPGNLILSFIAGIIDYPSTSKGRFEGGVEIGWQFNLFKYLSLALTSGAGIRKGSQAGSDMCPISLKGGLRVRMTPWLYAYGEGGVEFVKVSGVSQWQYPFKDYGGGLLFRMGAADKKAEYNLYKAVHITRVMLILGMDVIRAKTLTDQTPDGYLIKSGMSFEF